MQTEDLRLFVHIAELGNLTRAAGNLGILPATASLTIKRLERQTACRLFERSTRNMRLTAQGQVFLDYCRRILAILDEAGEALKAGATDLRGHVRVSAPSDWGRNVLLPWLAEFQLQHPEVMVTAQCSDRFTDLFRDPVDLAFRYGKLDDSSLVSRHLADNRRILVASPAYLERHGMPESVEELHRHNCLLHNLNQVFTNTWRFKDESGTPLEVKVRGDRMADDGDIVHKWASAGVGIAYKSWLDVRADVEEGRLVQLLGHLEGEDWPLNVVYPHRQSLSAPAREVARFVGGKLAA